MAERERLRELAIEGLAKLMAHQARTSATERGIQTAVRLLALDPLQEVVHRTLMRLYPRQGRQTAALRQYQMCVELLQRELRTEPEAETKQLYQELLQQRREARERGPAARPSEPRVRSSGGGERLELPVRGTPLIGRDTELGRLLDLARQAREGQGRAGTDRDRPRGGRDRQDPVAGRGRRRGAGHCHLGFGRLALRVGAPEQAREHLTTAVAMYREMDMGFWLEKAEAELRKSIVALIG